MLTLKNLSLESSDSMSKIVPLTNYMNLPNAAHILYFFENITNYTENMMAYIKAGLDRGHHLLIIENSTIYNEVKPWILKLFTNEQQKCIHHMDNYTFYNYYGDFHIQSILKNFDEVLEPFFSQDISIRTWAHVEWQKQDDISCKIEEFESLADFSVNNNGLMSVCAYDASDVTASLQTTMMRSHEYLMTDTELVQSTLYRKSLSGNVTA